MGILPGEGFRKTLRGELPVWLEEGLITPEQAEKLTRRYALESLKDAASNRLLLAIYLIGAVLIGGGVISFVAANWEGLPPAFKVVLLCGAFAASYALGAFWWIAPGRRPKLGHACVLLGTLIFGANIGLLSQIFHVQGHYTGGLMLWATGAAAMAFAVASVPMAFLATAISLAWFLGGASENATAIYYPPLVLLLGGGFALWRQSPVILVPVLLAAGLTESICTGAEGGEDLLFLATLCACGAAFAGLGFLLLDRAPRRALGVGALSTGVFGFLLGLYVLSFHDIGDEIVEWWQRGGVLQDDWSVRQAGEWLIAAMLLVWSGVRHRGISPQLPLLAGLGLSILTLMLGLVSGYYFYFVVAANLGLAIMVVALGWTGVRAESRLAFWAGLLLAGLVVISRFLEYETGLLVKSAVFIACGLAVIAGGVWFERAVRQKESSHV